MPTANSQQTIASSLSPDVLIKCENVSKKFCRNFKQSLVYGLKDVMGTMVGKSTNHNKLRKNEFWAVKDINFELRRGECLGLIGHNGAGKSTLLKMLNGLITPDQGKITMRGRIGALIELGAGFNPILTGRENIYNNGAVLGFTREEIEQKMDAIIEFSEIGEFIDSPVQNYSSGMKVRLGFAVAAQMEPDVLIIDEVLAVGDMGFIIKCLNRISEMMANCAMIFVSHSMPMMARVSTQVMLMNHGLVEFHSTDLSEGILRYISMFEAPESKNQGTGEVQVNKIAIRNPVNGELVYDSDLTLKTYDDLEILVKLEFKETVTNFEWGITTFDGQLREALATSSNLSNLKFENRGAGFRTFKIIVPKLILATGKYSITLYAVEPVSQKFYCRMTNAITFNMQAIGNTWATTLVPGEFIELEK